MSDIYNLADTWNSVGTVFTAIKMNVTDTASASTSLLMDLQIGSVSKFSVSKSGEVTIPNNGGYRSLKADGTSVLIFQLDNADALNVGNASISHMQVFTASGKETRFLNNNGASRIMSLKESTQQIAMGNSGSNFDGSVTIFDNTATTGDSTLCIRNGAARAARVRFGTGGTYDVGLNREAAGILAVQDASTTLTNYRDLKARNVVTPGVTIASLQSASTQGAGARAFVTDALTPTFGSAVVGGGAVKVPVYSDGTNWIVG